MHGYTYYGVAPASGGVAGGTRAGNMPNPPDSSSSNWKREKFLLKCGTQDTINLGFFWWGKLLTIHQGRFRPSTLTVLYKLDTHSKKREYTQRNAKTKHTIIALLYMQVMEVCCTTKSWPLILHNKRMELCSLVPSAANNQQVL